LKHEEFLPPSHVEVVWKYANLRPINTSTLRTLRGISFAGFAWKNEHGFHAALQLF
jgi:hypothetical protein